MAMAMAMAENKLAFIRHMLVPVPMSVQVVVAALVASQVVAVAMAVLGAL